MHGVLLHFGADPCWFLSSWAAEHRPVWHLEIWKQDRADGLDHGTEGRSNREWWKRKVLWQLPATSLCLQEFRHFSFLSCLIRTSQGIHLSNSMNHPIVSHWGGPGLIRFGWTSHFHWWNPHVVEPLVEMGVFRIVWSVYPVNPGSLEGRRCTPRGHTGSQFPSRGRAGSVLNMF